MFPSAHRKVKGRGLAHLTPVQRMDEALSGLHSALVEGRAQSRFLRSWQ